MQQEIRKLKNNIKKKTITELNNIMLIIFNLFTPAVHNITNSLSLCFIMKIIKEIKKDSVINFGIRPKN